MPLAAWRRPPRISAVEAGRCGGGFGGLSGASVGKMWARRRPRAYRLRRRRETTDSVTNPSIIRPTRIHGPGSSAIQPASVPGNCANAFMMIAPRSGISVMTGNYHPARAAYPVSMDDRDVASQPTCPSCGTVLREIRGGYVCRECNQAYVGDIA